VARIGGLDERFGSGNFEDDDFCIRAFQAGYRARIAVDAFIHHTGSQTFRAAKIDYRGSLMRNWGLFKAKWGIPADAPYEQGYHFPPPSAPSVPLSVPLPDIGADHRCELSERWWQEIDGDHGRCEPAVAGETRCSAIIIPNGQGIAPLWSSLVQHTNQPLAITIVPSTVGNGNVGELPGTSCPDGWQIGTADVPAVQLLNRLLQSAGDKPVILLSGEVVVTPGWLKRLLTACDRNPHLAMVGPAMNDGPVPQQVKADYKGTGKALRQFALRRAHRFGKQLAATDHLAPSCIVLNPVVCRAIGSLREDLDLAASLADFSVRVREAGRPVAVALDTYVHCGQSTAACCH
jgi:GT2 family glycosyltransferase